MSPPRFLVSSLPESGIVELDAGESKHASNVLRLETGAVVALFDGAGGEALGTIESMGKRQVLVAVTERIDTNRELRFDFELCIALPKGDRQKTLVDGLVQLGVTRLTPLITRRGVAQPTENAIARLQRSVIESSKQSGRNRLLVVDPPQSISDVAARKSAGAVCAFAHPYGALEFADWTQSLIAGEPVRDVCVAIGPEGGFDDSEVERLEDAEWQRWSLGPRILRVEIAAIAIAAAIGLR